MEKSKLIKMISILIISVIMVMLFNVTTLAEDSDDAFNDLTSTLNQNNSVNNNITNNNTNNNTNNSINNNNTANNNRNAYNSSNLPKTGIGDSIPVALLVVVFGVSAVYAYRKIKEYKNI